MVWFEGIHSLFYCSYIKLRIALNLGVLMAVIEIQTARDGRKYWNFFKSQKKFLVHVIAPFSIALSLETVGHSSLLLPLDLASFRNCLSFYSHIFRPFRRRLVVIHFSVFLDDWLRTTHLMLKIFSKPLFFIFSSPLYLDSIHCSSSSPL